METEAETLESISIMKLEEEVKDLNCSQLDATINEASLSEFQKNEDQHFSPPRTVENSIQAEPEVATDKDTVHHFLEGKDGSFESESFLESPSLANIAVEEICRTSDDCKDKEKPILVKNEQDKVMQLENDVVEAKHHIPESAEIDVLGRQNSTATTLNNARTEYKEVAEPSELPAEGNNVRDYMVGKLPSLPITSTLVDLSGQEGKLGGGEGEVMEERKQMTETLFNDKKNIMEKVQKDDCLVEKSDEQMSEAMCTSQSIQKEKAVSGSQKDEVEDKSSDGDPLIESGVSQTIGATPDHNHEASLVPALIKESLTNDDKSEATKKAEVSIDKNMEVVACNEGESLYKNTESIPIEQELENTNLHKEGIEGKEQDMSSNLLIMEKGPESIIQTEEIENKKKEGDENQQASLRDTCISTAMASPGIQNGEADNLEGEESTNNKFEIPSFTTITEEANSQTAKPEESGILEYASSFTLEAKKDAEKLKEEVCKRHEIANSNEYTDKQIIQGEEAINDQSAVSSGEEIIKCTQEDEEEEKHDVEVSEGIEVAGTSKNSEGQIMEAEDVEEHSTGKQEDVEEMTMETDTNILSKEVHQKTTTEDDGGTIQHYSNVSDGEENVKDNSHEDEKKAKDTVEGFEGLKIVGAGEDTQKQIVEDEVFTNLSTKSIGEQTIKESEVKETNSTDSTQRPSSSIDTEASEDIHKEHNEKLVGPSLLVSEDHIEGKNVKKAEITSDKLETESVTLVTEKTSLHQAEQEDVKLICPSSLPSEEMIMGTVDFQALDVEEVNLVEHSKLDENANESILTTEKPDANKAEDDIKYDVIERACVTESESEHHGIERTTGMEITASETPKDEEEDKLFECSTSASTQPELQIFEAQENIKDETLMMEEQIQGEKREAPMAVQGKEENFTLKEEICMFEETSKIEPEDIRKETAFEELQKQEPVEYKDAHKIVEETCIENFEQETAGELENTSSFTQEKSLDINKSYREINDEYAREDEIQDKNKIDISEIVETRDEEVQEQSSEKDGSEVEAKEICVNVVSERVDTAASGSVAAKDTSDNVEETVENLQGFVEEKEGAGPKIEVEDFTNVEVLQQNIKQVDSCERIQSTEIEIPYKHHDESSASTDKSGEEIDEKNNLEEAHQAIEASKVSRSEAATSEHEASGFIQTSEIECVKLEKTGDLNLKEEQDYIDAKEVTTNQEEILDKDLDKSETEGVNTEERITDKDNVAKDIITTSLADEIAGPSCQEDETEQQQIAEPVPELKGEDLLHKTSDADDITTNGTPDEEVYEGCKTGDSGESKEKQLKDVDCTVKNVSAVSTGEETVDERSRAESPKEVLEGLETVNADEHIEKQIIKEDVAANDPHTVAAREETVKESSQKDREVAEKREIECEASSIIHLSKGLQEGRPSEDTSEQMIEENDDANDNSTVYAGKEEHKAGINISDIPNREETITENPHKEEEETNKQEGEVKESNLIPEEQSFEATDSTAKTRTVTLEDEEDTNKNSAAITVIEVSEEEQHIDNSEKLNETSALLSEVSKEQVKEEVLEQPEKTNNKLETSFITMETENMSLLESEQDITDLVNSTGLPSAETSPSCPASVTTLHDLDVEDIKLEETSTITVETENVSLQESELETTNLVDATDIPSREMCPGYPANVKASATTLQALDVEDLKFEEASSGTMETEKISLYESELENLVNATNSPSGEMSPGCPTNVEASATTLQALDVEDMKLEERISFTKEPEKASVHESELEPTNLVDSTDLPSGEISPGCPANLEASATTLHALDVEDMKLEETSSITRVSLHEPELEPTNLVDSTDPPSGEMSPGCPGNVEASVTTLQALDVEDLKLEETSSVDTTNVFSEEMSPGCPASATTLQALDVEDIELGETSAIAVETEKISLHESELETTNVHSTDLPSKEMNPGCPANVEASATALQALDVEDMELEETSPGIMETEKISLYESELENLVDATDSPSGEMSPGCPTNVEASATTLQALDVEDMKLEERISFTKEPEKASVHESKLEPTNLVDSTDLPSGEISPGCPANLEASATTLHALDVEDMKLEETSSITRVSLHEPELEPTNLVDSTDPPSGEMSPGCPGNVEASATTLQALDVEDLKLEETSSVDTTNVFSEEMSPGCPASATTLQALDVEDIELGETSAIAVETEKISLHESELETTNVHSTDLPSKEMNPGCPANVEASATALQALDVEDMELEETSPGIMETEKISLYESELENLVDATDSPSGEMSPGCPTNVEASATTLQALDLEDMKLEERSSFTKEPEKASVHESELEPTNLVDSTDLPSGEISLGCPTNLEASVTTLHALDVEDMKLEEISSITRVSLHESELEPTNLVDSTDPPSGEMSPGCPGNVEASATTLQALDVEAMKLEETSNINDNANEEIRAAEKPDAAEAVEGMKYNIMLEEDSGTEPVDDEQGTEAEITAKICSDDKSEETSNESSTPIPGELGSIEAQEKITDHVPIENETRDEKLEIPSVAQKEKEEMPIQQEEENRKVEEDTEMGSEGREVEYVNELQNREGKTKDKYLELSPEKHIMENFFVKPTQFSEYSKTEGSETESENGKSVGEKNFDELAEEPESTGACAYVEKDILDKGRSESMKVKDEVVEDQSHERNEVSNATMKETIIENPKAVDPTKKLTDTSESDAENQNHATLIETKKTETEEEGNIISISVEDQIIGKNFQEDKEHENLEDAGRRSENEDQSGKINYVNETSQGFILDAEVPHEDERPEESDKIQKQIMEEQVASQELYTASVNDEAVKEVKSADVVSIKQNFQVIDSSEKTETESAMDEKDWNKSNVSPITTESGEELPKKEGSDMLETPSVIVATEERSSEEVEPDAEKNVVVSSIGFEEKSLQTVETTETSEKDDGVNLEERLESVSQLLTFEDENRNQENLTGENLDGDKVEEGIRDELVIASVAASQPEGPMEHVNPESDTAAVRSLTVTAEEPEQKGQQCSQLEYGEQKLEIPETEMIKDNPMIEDVPRNMENTEIESTSDQNVEANKSEAREIGVSAAEEERKGEAPIENETQDTKKVEVPSVPKTIEGKFPHKEEECKELKASETGSEYIEKVMQHAEQMKEENLEITPEFIFNKNDSESTDVVSFLEKETEKTEELTETTEDSEKDTLKVDKATETGLREDEPQIHPYKKSIDGVFQEPETVGASTYPGTDVLENRDISENENPEEENSEAISLVEKIVTLESKNTPKNEEDSHNINEVVEETLAGEADRECGDATNVELEKLTGALESVTEAQIHDMLNETKKSQNSEDEAVAKDPDTVSVGDEIIQEDKMADENVNVEKKIEEEEAVHPGQVYVTKTAKDEEDEEKGKEVGDEIKLDLEDQSHDFKAHEMQSEKTDEGNENTEKEGANQEVVFEGSAQKPDLKFVGEETVKDSHQAGQKGEEFGDGVNPSYPTAEGTGEHIKDETPVEEILQKETEQTLYEAINQDVVCEDENTSIQIPRQGEPGVFLNDERETAERSITDSLDDLDKTSNMVLQEQSQVKTDLKSETQVNGNETKESTKIEDADSLNENIREMPHIHPLRKEVLVKEGITELASVAEIEKSTITTTEEQTPREVKSTESTEEENSTGSTDISPMPMEPIEKTFGKAEAEDQKSEQSSEIESEEKGVTYTESIKEEISTGSTDISPMPMEPIEKTFGKAEAEDQKPEKTSEIESEVKEVECGIEESTDEPKPSDLNKFSLSDHLQKSIKETLETVRQSGDETESKVNKEEVAPNIQVEEEKTDEGKDKHDQDEEEDEHKKSDSGSDAPVMVEASRDVEVKPAHKKSHNILSGVGSKVKNSIAKVKKAITGKSSHHKQSSPKQESESTVTAKAAADPNL